MSVEVFGMASFQIRGGCSLNGEVRIQGSKNAALPMLAACLLSRGETKLYNCPHITDVYNMIKILENMGCSTVFCGDCLTVDTSGNLSGVISMGDGASMRSSIMLMGAVLGRQKYVSLPWPGGCSIGKRPVDLHLKALEQMNVSIRSDHCGLECTTPYLQGKDICLPIPSVGATENVILAAVLARGTTTIYNAAKEPEIVDLCHFLNEMGAQIHGMGTHRITINGVKQLKSISYTVMPDRIVAGTYFAAAAATGGNILAYPVKEKDLRSVLDVFAAMGCGIIIRRDQLQLIAPPLLLPVESICTRPFPGFPTDMQSQLMACLTAARGTSVICENIFEDRFKIVPQLEKMGAKILVNENKAVIRGGCRLTGSCVSAQDLRGGAALVIAGLMAEGDTRVEGSGYIERGYEDICRDFSQLGAGICRL